MLEPRRFVVPLNGECELIVTIIFDGGE